jgi:hypothetical protein
MMRTENGRTSVSDLRDLYYNRRSDSCLAAFARLLNLRKSRTSGRLRNFACAWIAQHLRSRLGGTRTGGFAIHLATLNMLLPENPPNSVSPVVSGWDVCYHKKITQADVCCQQMITLFFRLIFASSELSFTDNV